jgi:hypothetical protein
MRNVLKISLLWGIAWALLAAAAAVVIGIVRPQEIDAGEGPIDVAPILGRVGLIAGAAFALLLAIAERGRRMSEIPFLRAVLWGTIAAALYPLLTDRVLEVFVLAPFGALLAWAHVAIARKRSTIAA